MPRSTITLTLILTAIAMHFAATPPAIADDEAPSWSRPSYNIGQPHLEDWSTMTSKPADAESDLFDSIKHISLSDGDDVWLSIGGSARARIEVWEDFGFGSRNDDAFLLTRVLLHGDLHAGDNFRVFVEGKSAMATERDLPGRRRTLDIDEFDLQQGFVDVVLPIEGNMTLTLRPGRQNLQFGKQRLVSPLPWSNSMRSWDGVSAIVDGDGWQVHSFWTQFAPVQKYDFNDPDSQTQFFGAYATCTRGPVGVDVYYLGLDRDDRRVFNGTAGREDRHTIGGRLFGKCECGVDYDIEAAYQFGNLGGNDINAFMVGSQFGYAFTDCPATPRVWLGFDYASGDNGAGGDVETFNQLFPLGHAYFGYMDVIGRQNIVDLSAGIGVKPLPTLGVNLAGHYFRRADDADAVYNAGGGIARAAGASGSNDVGWEIDLTATYAFDRHLSALFGYSHFEPGDFIEQTGAASATDFVYIQFQYAF